MGVQIHTKTGVEKTLVEILEAYRSLYPHKFQFFMDSLRKMREVQKNSDGSFVDRRGRWARISIRVPTELYLFIARHIDNFGLDNRDNEILLRVAKDLVSTDTKLVGRKRIYRVNARKKEEDGAQRRDDSPQLESGSRGVHHLTSGEQVSPGE